MEPSFVDEIKKKTSLVKFVVNTDTATDIISYLYKETERQKSEIDTIKKKLEDMNADNNNNSTSNQNKYDQLSERINELSIQMNKKIDDFNAKTNDLIKEKINDINMKTDSLSKKFSNGDNSQSAFSEFLHQLNLLRNEVQTLRKNTSEILGVDEKELNKSKPNRNINVEGSNQNPELGNSKTIPNATQNSKNPDSQTTVIQQLQVDSSQNTKEQISLQEILDQINQLRGEIKQIKESNLNSNYAANTINNNNSYSNTFNSNYNANANDFNNNNTTTNNNSSINNNGSTTYDSPTTNDSNAANNDNISSNSNNKNSSKVITRIIKKKEKKVIKDFKDQEVEVKMQTDLEEDLKSEEENKLNSDTSGLKIDNLNSIYQEIEKLKQAVDDQANQLKKIETTTKNGQVSLDDYIQEILQSAMKCDSESQKLTNDYKNLQNLLINSVQEIKERMDSMLDQFNEMATKEEVMSAFSEVINPKTPQNGTSIGVSKCKFKCLACGRTRPSVISATDSNLAEILHYQPLRTKSEIFRPGAKVTLLNKEVPITSRESMQLKDSTTPRRPKTSRS